MGVYVILVHELLVFSKFIQLFDKRFDWSQLSCFNSLVICLFKSEEQELLGIWTTGDSNFFTRSVGAGPAGSSAPFLPFAFLPFAVFGGMISEKWETGVRTTTNNGNRF
jgi:hypothetical protein